MGEGLKSTGACFKCPTGVRGRNSDNKLYKEKIGWEVNMPLQIGMEKTFEWINLQVLKSNKWENLQKSITIRLKTK